MVVSQRTKYRPGVGGMGPDNVFSFFLSVINVFNRGSYLPREAIEPLESNCFSRGGMHKNFSVNL